ncbi:MAG: ROK family protein [Candidatus Omnitrophica bacterium]|nr:ROK family protein [Candidatus Omnitrophota bacterium]
MVIQRKVLSDEEISDKGKKNLMILDAIRKRGPLARTDVSKGTGINIVTVSNYIDSYIKQGLVIQRGLDTSTGGRRPLLVELNSQAGYAVGIGMNVAEVICIITDMTSKVVFKLKKNRPLESGDKLLDYLMDVTDETIKKSNIDTSKIKGIGVGTPGIVDKEKHTVHWPRGLFSSDISVSISVTDLFAKRFSIPALVDNDANTAVFGEKWLTLEPNIKNLLYMYSGLGCGIMIDGKIYRGSSGCAGEFVFRPDIDYIAWIRQSHDTNVWEIDLGLTSEARKIVKNNPASLISKLVDGNTEKVDFFTVVKAVKERDPLVLALVDKAAVELGRRVASLVNLLNPEIVVIGGGVEGAGAYFLEAIKRTVKESAIEEATRKLKIIPARLGEEAIALGAASLVVQNIFIDA